MINKKENFINYKDSANTSVTFHTCDNSDVKGVMEMGKNSRIFFELPYRPNFFWRFMQWLFFGFVWKNETK